MKSENHVDSHSDGLEGVAHPLAEIFPMIVGAEFQALKDDIQANGLREPIWLYEDKILDGRNRFAACNELDIEPVFRHYDGTDPLSFVLSLNLHRRHLSESQRAMVAAKLATLPKGANQHAQICAPSQAQAAEKLNVSRRSVQTAAKVQADAVPELVRAVEQGAVKVSAAAALADLPKEQQAAAVAAGPAEVKKVAAEARRTAEKPQVVEEQSSEHEDASDGAFDNGDVIEALKEEITSLHEQVSLLQAAANPDFVKMVKDKDEMIKVLQHQRDGYMSECAQLKKEIKKLQRALEKKNG